MGRKDHSWDVSVSEKLISLFLKPTQRKKLGSIFIRKKLLFIVGHRPKAESERVLEQTKDVGSGIFKVGFSKTQHQKNQNSVSVRLHAVVSLRCVCFVETTIFMTKGHVNSAWKKVLFSYKKLCKKLFI